MSSKANTNPSLALRSPPQARSSFGPSFMDSGGSSRPKAPSPAHRPAEMIGGSVMSDSLFTLDPSPARSHKTTSTPFGPSLGLSKPGSSFFLKPRSAGITSSTSPSDRGRSRKRSANSISASASSISSSVAGKQLFVERPSERRSSVGNDDETAVSTPASSRAMGEVRLETYMSPGRVDTAAFTFQNLSLRSPRPPSVETISPIVAFGSSFSRYVASPSESLQHEAFPDPFEGPPHAQRRASPMSSMSSPKIAPLTVLTHESKSTPTSRPPRHGKMASLMHSLDQDPESADDASPETPKRPPLMVHCRDCSDTSVLDVLESPMKKQARADGVETPVSRCSDGAFQHLPLPRINLTPRSSASRTPKICLTPRSSASQSLGLPRFPSPSPMQSPHVPQSLFVSQEPSTSESDMPQKIASTGGNHSGYWRNAMPKQSYESSSSLALSLDSPKQSPEGTDFFISVTRSVSAQSQTHLSNLRSQSLLHPPSNVSDMRAMLESERIACGGDDMNDNESLSDSDDEPFVLASPAAIGQEKQARAQQSKHRRLGVKCTDGLTTSSRTHPSASSLLGTDFLSASNLRGMDRAHQGQWSSSSRPPPSLTRTESSQSIGLALDKTQSMAEDVPRDLVTPPAMEAARSPPPLSPREDPYGPSKHRTYTATDHNHLSFHDAIAEMVRQKSY